MLPIRCQPFRRRGVRQQVPGKSMARLPRAVQLALDSVRRVLELAGQLRREGGEVGILGVQGGQLPLPAHAGEEALHVAEIGHGGAHLRPGARLGPAGPRPVVLQNHRVQHLAHDAQAVGIARRGEVHQEGLPEGGIRLPGGRINCGQTGRLRG